MSNLTAKTSIWLSDEALQAEQEVIDALDFGTTRKQRFEMAFIILAQVMRKRKEGMILFTDLNFKNLPE